MGSSPGGYLLPGGVGYGGISHQNKFRTTFVSCTEITRKLISRVFFFVRTAHACMLYMKKVIKKFRKQYPFPETMLVTPFKAFKPCYLINLRIAKLNCISIQSRTCYLTRNRAKRAGQSIQGYRGISTDDTGAAQLCLL